MQSIFNYVIFRGLLKKRKNKHWHYFRTEAFLNKITHQNIYFYVFILYFLTNHNTGASKHA